MAGEALGTIGAILAITGAGFGLLAIALGLSWLFAPWPERPTLEPIYGDFVNLPEDLKGASNKGGGGGAPNKASALRTSHVRTHDDGASIS